MTPETYWFAAEIASAAKTAGIDPTLLQAQIEQESGGITSAYRFEPLFWQRYGLGTKPPYAGKNPRRVSASYGLLQILYVDAVELGYVGSPEALFSPAEGLAWGCKKLANLIEWAKGDVEQALAAYNGGKGGNDKRPFRNGTYATQVLARQKYLKSLPENPLCVSSGKPSATASPTSPAVQPPQPSGPATTLLSSPK